MSSSSDAFVPLDATVPVVPAVRRRGGRPRPAFPASPQRSEATVAARFSPLIDLADDTTSTLASREQARAAGFAAGFAAGSREAAQVAAAEARATRRLAAEAEASRAAEHDQAVAALQAAVRSVRARELPVLASVEQRLFASAVELAQAVLGVELSDAETSARAVLARVASVELPGDVVLRMNPRDAAVVGVVPDGLRIVPDPRLAIGDAVAEHADGELDARLSSALDRARAALTEQAGSGAVVPQQKAGRS